MKVFLLQPTGQKSYQLFDTMVGKFSERGHSFVHDVADADVVFYDLWNVGGIYSKRDVEKVIFWQRPVVGFDFKDQWGDAHFRPQWWGFDGNKILGQKAEDGHAWAIHLKEFLGVGLVKLMFVRKMAKSWTYPDWVRPIEVAIWPDHDFDLVSMQEFAARPHGVCWIGNATPWRANAVSSLCRGRIDVDFFFPLHRLEHADWLARHRNSIMFLEADGGGFGSERPAQLGRLAVQLRVRNDQKMAHPWVDGVNCIEVGDSMGIVTKEECESLKDKLSDIPLMYSIYMNGAHHLRKHYSTDARANYVLEQMETVGLK